MKNRIPRKLKKKIPKGHYCYTPLYCKDHVMHIKPCPFYNKIEYLYSRCKLIGIEIEDQCKSCGINLN